MNVVFFDPVNIKVPKERIYSRLGYCRSRTRISRQDFLKSESYLDFALSKIHLKGAAGILAINQIKEAEVFLEGNLIIKSRSLAEFLRGCREILFLGATAGRDIMEVISAASGKGSLTRSVVADAAASEMVDSALGWIVDYQARCLRRQNKFLTRQRFSAGYGDFGLEYQKMIYNLLNLAKIGIKLRETYLLEPEKSVTAACGIKS